MSATVKPATQTIALFALLTGALFAPMRAFAHASEQAFVLLLPTKVYITSGVLAVALTIVVLALAPQTMSHGLLRAKRLFSKNPQSHSALTMADITSIVTTLLLAWLIWTGLTGSHDPLKNPLPLFIWTLWWIGFVVIQGIVGNLWRWLNPWTGLYRLCTSFKDNPHRVALPAWLGHWPAVIVLLLFMVFALADIAPDSPTRLSIIVGVYWLVIFIGMLLFGDQCLKRVEAFSVLLSFYSQLAWFGRIKNDFLTGFAGWHALANPTTTISAAVFVLVLLGTGSFDGFNETFYWLNSIGINPLEFPGRSAVVTQTVVGLLLATALLIAVYAACIYLGVTLANRQIYDQIGKPVHFRQAFCYLAIAILPIAFAYHFAHFLTTFLVNAQYALAAASDPFDTGADLLGLGTFYVTTGFMNSHHTVEAIWLTQAAAVVFGHVLSVLLAHALALDLFGSARRAIISQVPLAVFMVGYTFIGLWLLAAPRGA